MKFHTVREKRFSLPASAPKMHAVGNRGAEGRFETYAATAANRRKHARAALTSKVQLLLETRDGLVTVSAYVLDISVSGCQLHLSTRIEPGLAGRVQLPLGGKDVWLPIVTRWVQQDARGWSVGAEFDRPTPAKQDLVRRFVSQRIG